MATLHRRPELLAERDGFLGLRKGFCATISEYSRTLKIVEIALSTSKFSYASTSLQARELVGGTDQSAMNKKGHQNEINGRRGRFFQQSNSNESVRKCNDQFRPSINSLIL